MGAKLRHNQKRTARLDLRVTPKDKELIDGLAAKTRRTVTSYIEEWFDILRKDEEPKK